MTFEAMLYVLWGGFVLSGGAAVVVLLFAAGTRVWICVRIRRSADGWFVGSKMLRECPWLAVAVLPMARTDRSDLARGYYRTPANLTALGSFLFAYAYIVFLELIVVFGREPGSGTELLGLTVALVGLPVFLAVLMVLAVGRVLALIDPSIGIFGAAVYLMRSSRVFVSRQDSRAHRFVVSRGLYFMARARKLGVPAEDSRLMAIHRALTDTGRVRRNVCQVPENVHGVLTDICDGRFEFARNDSRNRAIKTDLFSRFLKVLGIVTTMFAPLGVLASIARLFVR